MDLPPGNKGRSHGERQPALECKTRTFVAIPGLVTPRWVEEAKKMWGNGSTQYQVRVLGEFPSQSDDTLIPLVQIETAVSTQPGLRQHVCCCLPYTLQGRLNALLSS